MQFDLSTLEKLLEDRPNWLVAATGVLAAALLFALIRGLMAFWRVLTADPSKPRKRRGFLNALLRRADDDCVDMDALSNTPDREPAVSEKRTSFRRRDNVVEIMLAVEPGAEPRRAWVIDRSSSGLGIVVKVKVKPGTVIGVRPLNAPPTAPWVDVEVRSCARQEQHYRLGCKFLQTPEWGLLLMFG